MKRENYEAMEKLHLKRHKSLEEASKLDMHYDGMDADMKDALALADRMIEIDKIEQSKIAAENERKLHPKDILSVVGTVGAAIATAVVKGLFDRAINNDSIRSHERIAEAATNFEKDGTYTTTAGKVVIREALIK